MGNQVNPFILKTVRATTNKMTLDELAAIFNAVTAGFDPHSVMGYEKAKPLFTEAGGTRMHRETLDALDIIVGERLDAGE